MVWDRVEWRQGDGRYVFEVARGGLLATLSSPHGAKLTLPMVAWEGLLDALAAARKTKARTERSLPSRTGARWSESEAQELAKAFKAGGSIAQLARVHNRTQFALEAQLERQGLWDRAERRPTARVVGDHPPPGTISAYPTATTGYPSSAAIRPSGPAPVPDRRPDAKPQPPFGKVDVHQRLPAGPEPSRFNRDVPATQKPGASAPASDRLEGAGGDLRPKG